MSDGEGEGKSSKVARITKRILATLTPWEEQLLRGRFGISMNCDSTLEEVGRQLETIQARIREFERRALAKYGNRPKDPEDDPGSPAPI